LSRCCDDDLGAGFAGITSDLFNRLNHVHAGCHPSKDDVFAIQPASLSGAQEELASVGVGAGIGHGKDSRSGVLLDEVFIGKFVAVDGLASGAVASGKVAALAHEPGDDAMESRALVSEAFLARAKSAEILGRLRAFVRVERHDDTSGRSTADRHIEKYVDFRHFLYS